MGGALSCVCGRSLLNINGTKYIFQENLGEGGFSYVDLLEDSKSGQFVALKRIVCHDKKAELDGLQEAEYCRRFQHDNILPLIDHCVREKQKLSEVWLVFPFYKHGTLYDEYQRLSSTNQTMS
uniref:non-specific serine/threonine protein kinase n=1 Tax=Ciona savignyi TaxID=51511 RepID=H2YRJ0_CIOSA